MKPSELSPYGALDDAMTEDERAAFLEAYGGQAGYDAHQEHEITHARMGHEEHLHEWIAGRGKGGNGTRGG